MYVLCLTKSGQLVWYRNSKLVLLGNVTLNVSSLVSASEASSSVSGVSSASSTVKKVEVAKKDLASVVAPPKDLEAEKNNVSENGDDELAAGGGAVEGEDTMQNLRKTFAGIFGDIKQ